MSDSILSNVTAMAASRQLGITSMGMQQTITRLTTGKQINTAQDNAVGLAQADQFNAESIAATQNVQTQNNAYFQAQAGDGYLGEATTQVQTLVQLDSGGNGTSAEATAVIGNAQAAITKALANAPTGSAAATDLALAATAVSGIASATDAGKASAALTAIDVARGDFGATMASTQSASNLFGIESENATSEESNVMDANVGNEVVNLTKWQVLSQAGTSALSSANSSSQYILALFR
jgi:flagellin